MGGALGCLAARDFWPYRGRERMRRQQLKVQISLPHCSLHERPCLCNAEDVLNGRAQAVNHLVITAGVSQPRHVIKPSSGPSDGWSLNHRRAGLSHGGFPWIMESARPYAKVRQQAGNHVSYHRFLKNSSRVKGLALSQAGTTPVVSQGLQTTEQLRLEGTSGGHLAGDP